MKRLRSRLERAARSDVPVLLTGETGTGKTLAARVLHGASPRRNRPFVPVNCAGIPGTLFESEVFGHERGAFTGAVERRKGLFETAHRGTLFLDELGELAPEQQAKLLTVLDHGELRRVGADHTVAVDVRLVSATSKRLRAAEEDRPFRPDLYHRLAVVRIRIPPLRERPEDIGVLAEDCLSRLARRHGAERVRLTPGGLSFLEGRSWPGNVRELVHVLEAALVLSGSPTLGAPALREVMQEIGGDRPSGSDPPPLEGSGTPSRRYSFYGSAEAERERIRRALERCRGNKTRAARLLGMSRTTLRGRVRRYGLDREGGQGHSRATLWGERR